MKAKRIQFTSLDEAQNYFAKKNVLQMSLTEAVETKYIAKTILHVLQQNDAPGVVTNFWYMLYRLSEERLQKLGYKDMEVNTDTILKVVHIFPKEMMQEQPQFLARHMFEHLSNEELEGLLNQTLEEKPLSEELLRLIRAEYARRNKLN